MTQGANIEYADLSSLLLEMSRPGLIDTKFVCFMKSQVGGTETTSPCTHWLIMMTDAPGDAV